MFISREERDAVVVLEVRRPADLTVRAGRTSRRRRHADVELNRWRAIRAAATVLLLLIPLLVLVPAAHAASGDGGLRDTGRGRPPKVLGTRPEEEPSEEQLLEPPSGSTETSLAKELGSSGQVDPITGLGIRNPVCDEPAQIHSRETRTSCEITGTPETTYPTSDYGFDVFIPTGVTHPIGDFTAGFVTILNGIWLGLLFVLKLVLTLLGLAFGLNPFSDGPTMARISAAVSQIYATVTEPWLSALVVCAGIALAWRGLISRDVAGSVAGTIAAIAMLVLGLWVVHSPRESVGRLASFSNEAALGVIAAPQSGSLADPTGSYAEAMSHVWSRLVEVPFAGLDFSDVNWALGPPPEEAVKKANEAFCEDNGSLTLLAQLQNLGIGKEEENCGRFAEERYGKPKRVIDLYLRSSPGSAARAALWNYFDKEAGDQYKAKVAAQGGDGVITRLSMLALFAIGLLGALLLLAWLAIRLLTQAAIAFVLLLALPFALFFPLLGDWGRRGFRRFGLALIGAVLAKVIYAAFLSVVLLGIVTLGSVDGAGGSATGFLLSAAFSWAVFLKRGDLIGWISVGEHERLAGLGVGGVAGFALGRRVARSPARAVTKGAAAGARRSREHSRLATETTRRTAHGSLDGSARALADVRLHEARETVAAHERSRAGDGEDRKTRSGPKAATSSAKGDERTRGGPVRSGGRGARPARPAAAEPERVRAARKLIAGAERNEAGGGGRWSARDLRRFAQEDRALLRGSADPADHAHRIGMERSRFEQLQGPDRDRAAEQIEKARRRDAKRLEVSADTDGRLAVDRPRLALERIRQVTGGDAPRRREHLQALRRERRSGENLSPRRNLSRGA
jgi:hypothetical protein